VTVYEQFAMARRASGVSQGRLARVTGVNPTDVSQWELGNRDLHPDKVAALQGALREAIEKSVHEQQRLLEQLTA
jgi:transcriptional regulator with XRE-family HTH domain